jgi:hypothetical protein
MIPPYINDNDKKLLLKADQAKNQVFASDGMGNNSLCRPGCRRHLSTRLRQSGFQFAKLAFGSNRLKTEDSGYKGSVAATVRFLKNRSSLDSPDP